MGVLSSTNPDYLADVQIHQFCEDSTLTECGFETIAMANHEWDSIVESVDINEMSLFEAELLGLQEADKKESGFVDKLKSLGQKIIELLKKIAAYIFGMISKWLIALAKLVNKDAYTTKDKGRLLRGGKKLIEKAKDSKIHLYGLLCNKHDFPDYDAAFADIAAPTLKDSKSVSYEEITEARNGINQLLDETRGSMVGQQVVQAQDFKAAVTEYLTGHKEVAEYTFDGSSIEKAIGTALATINGGADKQKKRAKGAYDKIKDNINKCIEKVKQTTVKAKDIKDEEQRKNALAWLSVSGQIFKSFGSIAAAANSTFLSVMSADVRMSSQLLVKCYGAGTSDEKAKEEAKKDKKKEKKSTNESTESIFGTDLI